MPWESPPLALFVRVLAIAFVVLTAFGVAETWPRTLPRFLARWALQVIAATVVIPPTTALIYVASTEPGAPPFYKNEKRLGGFGMLTVCGILFVPWIAVAAVIRRRDEEAHRAALTFERERGLLERRALDARMKILQAQIQPHFLFNTLANVRQLVAIGSPRAPEVLDSLIAYLRAAVPRIDETSATLGQEIDLARSYLELMQLRMPDRLQYAIDADAHTKSLRCPPLTVLTLVENAIRHGIDPTEAGGRIDVKIERIADRCKVTVTDTGAGLEQAGASGRGLGTGLVGLRERLGLVFGGRVVLKIEGNTPRGVMAQLEFPAEVA